MKKFSRNFQKPLDKSDKVWYNIITVRETKTLQREWSQESIERNDTMYDFNECKKGSNPTKDKAREIFLADLQEFLATRYGAEQTSQVDGNMYAVCLGTRTLADGTGGEVCCTVEVVAKDFDVRVVESSGKVFQPYERVREEEEYTRKVEQTKAKAEENKRKKEEKVAKDKKAREEKKLSKEKETETTAE